jgi:hypothetical protein
MISFSYRINHSKNFQGVIVNKATANKVVAQLKAHFKEKFDYTPDLTLYPASHEGMSKGSWSIAGEGIWVPEEKDWTVYASEVVDVAGVFAEPRTGWSLGLYDA